MQFLYQNTSQVKDRQIQTAAKILAPYLLEVQKIVQDKNYHQPESFLNLASDKNLLRQVQTAVEQKLTPNLKYIFDLGIGGSNLGTKAIYDALWGFFDAIEPKRFPKIIFVDTNDANFLGRLQNLFKNEIQSTDQVLINTISKSGTTLETLVNLEILESWLPRARERLIITTNPNSQLAQTAKKQGLTYLSIPEKVGGRFSVLTAVGLFPLAAAGINIHTLLKGARQMRGRCLKTNVLQNPAALSAIIIYLNSQNGKIIHNSFFFHPELASLGAWYRQLTAESLGKGGQGITPTTAIGTTDLHSMLQLYLAGPKDKLTTFIWAKHPKDLVRVPVAAPFDSITQSIKGKSAAQVMQAIYQSVKITYQKQGLPFIEVVLPDLLEGSLGAFLQFKMMEIMYLGRLLKVNTFDQPAVESYKREARRILTKE